MRRLLLLTFVLLVSVPTIIAQKFIVNPWGDDQVECYEVRKSEKGWDILYDSKTKKAFDAGYAFYQVDSLKNGDGYVFEDGGKYYVIYAHDLKFADDNPSYMTNPLSEKTQARATMLGKFYSSMYPAYIVLLSILIAVGLSYLYMKGKYSLRKVVLIAIPAAIFVMSAVLIVGYMNFETKIFWWCDYDRYGFWSSLFRFFPFAAVVAAQVYSIKLYETVLLSDNPYVSDGLSIKPVAISVALCLPVAIITAIIAALMDIKGSLLSIITTIVFFVTLAIGLIKSCRKNMETLGKINGISFTIFSVVYIIGCLISLWALITLVFQLIFQILVVIFAIIMIYVLANTKTRRRRSDGTYEDY